MTECELELGTLSNSPWHRFQVFEESSVGKCKSQDEEAQGHKQIADADSLQRKHKNSG